MSPALERARVYLHQGRYEDVLREVAVAATEDPDNYIVFGYRALALANLDRLKDAAFEAERLVSMAPDVPWSHYIHCIVLFRQKRTKQAEGAIRHAIELDPEDAEYYAALAGILASQAKWKASLAAAEEGLALDPANEQCQSLRTQALSFTGKRDEALAAARATISENPDSADAHAEMGWVSLRRNDRKAAIKHFQESLRIDPEDASAREGLLDALRAGFPPYRVMLNATHQIARLPAQAQSAILIGAFILYRSLIQVMKNQRHLIPYLSPIAVLLGLFFLMRWYGELITDSILLFHPLGRLALGRTRRLEATIFSGFVVGGLVILTISFATPFKIWGGTIGAYVAVVLIGLVHNITSSPRWREIAFWAATVFGVIATLLGMAATVDLAR